MVPFRDKTATATAPVALQGEIEARASEPAEAVGRARSRGDLPAGHGGGGQRIAVMPQQQAKPAARLCGKREAARRGEIGGFAFLRQLGQNGGERPALEPFFEAPKRLAGMRDPQDQEPLERKPEQIEPDPIGNAAFAGRKLGRNAEHLAAVFRRRERRERERKAEGCAELQLACGSKLVQSPDRKAPLERRIEGVHAQPERALFGAQGGNAGQGKSPVPIACGRGVPSRIPFMGGKMGGSEAKTDEGCGHFCNL